MATDRKLISVDEAAERLGLKASTIRKYVLMQHIPFVKLGARVLFDPDRLDRWVAEHAREPVGSA